MFQCIMLPVTKWRCFVVFFFFRIYIGNIRSLKLFLKCLRYANSGAVNLSRYKMKLNKMVIGLNDVWEPVRLWHDSESFFWFSVATFNHGTSGDMLGQILLTLSWSLYQIAPKYVLSVKQGSAERIRRVFLYSESLLPSWVFLYLGIHLFVCKIKALLFFKVFLVCFSGCREKLKYDSSRIYKWKMGAFRWEM